MVIHLLSIFTTLKRGISIFFLLLYLLATTEVFQLGKLPLLFEHYHAHKMADKNLSFFSFIYEHYADSSTSDPDYLADMQLPFKSGNEHIALNITSLQFITQQQPEFVLFPIIISSSIHHSFYKQPSIPSAYLSVIWQPPKQG